MPTYAQMILQDLRAAGWEAPAPQARGACFLARATKAGHVCLAEGDGELGALVALQKSVREVEAGRLFSPGQVVRLRVCVGDIPPGHYAVASVDGAGLTLRLLGEDPETGDLCLTEKECRLPMGEAGKVERTKVRLDAEGWA